MVTCFLEETIDDAPAVSQEETMEGQAGKAGIFLATQVRDTLGVNKATHKPTREDTRQDAAKETPRQRPDRKDMTRCTTVKVAAMSL